MPSRRHSGVEVAPQFTHSRPSGSKTTHKSLLDGAHRKADGVSEPGKDPPTGGFFSLSLLSLFWGGFPTPTPLEKWWRRVPGGPGSWPNPAGDCLAGARAGPPSAEEKGQLQLLTGPRGNPGRPSTPKGHGNAGHSIRSVRGKRSGPAPIPQAEKIMGGKRADGRGIWAVKTRRDGPRAGGSGWRSSGCLRPITLCKSLVGGSFPSGRDRDGSALVKQGSRRRKGGRRRGTEETGRPGQFREGGELWVGSLPPGQPAVALFPKTQTNKTNRKPARPGSDSVHSGGGRVSQTLQTPPGPEAGAGGAAP